MPDLLWVDDDGPSNFLFETYQLQASGWTITFAEDAAAAVAHLQQYAFQAVILDQMLPRDDSAHGSIDVWTGYLLLWWLKRGQTPSQAPQASIEALHPLLQQPPLPQNRTIPVIMITAFHDDDVHEAFDKVRRSEPAVEKLIKPVDFDALLGFLTAHSTDAS